MQTKKISTAVIIFLNIIIVSLLVYILCMPKTPGGADSTGGGATIGGGNNGGGNGGGNVEDPPAHNKFREPSAGKNERILRETKLMGSGDESVIFVHFSGGDAYIFGNATVGDLDFDGYGGFLCIVGADGKIEKFTYYTGKMTAVGIVEGGFAVATIENVGEPAETSRIYMTDDGGNAREVVRPSGEVVDIMPVGSSRAAVVARPTVNSFSLGEYALGDERWTQERSTYISSGYTLEYFDCYKLGDGYILSARASSLPRYDSLVFYTFTAGGDASAHFYGGTGESLMQPYAVLPYSDGFLAVCRRDGVAALIGVDYSFMRYRRELLGFAFDEGSAVFCGDRYYASFVGADGRTVYEIDNNLSYKKIDALFAVRIDLAVSSLGKSTVFGKKDAAGDKGYTSMGVDGSSALSLDISDVVVHGASKRSDGTLVVLSATGGDDVQPSSGGRDIYVLLTA